MSWFNRSVTNSPGALWSQNRNAWCKEYFPEYYALFGGYPFGIRHTNRDPDAPRDGRPSMSGNTECAQIQPWLFAAGEIQANGVRLHEKYPERFGAARFGATPVPDAEFRAWCEGLNYFTNGHKGLNPEALVGALDVRDNAYVQRGRYSLVRCRSGGVFTFDEGPTMESPWGVNATYSKGQLVWQNDKYGPDHMPDHEGGNYPIDWYLESRDGPKPTQAEYDAARTPQARGF